MAKTDTNPKHRGRFQAQGGGLEESEPWAQNEPLSIKKALGLLSALIEKLSSKDFEKRRKSFSKAEAFVKEAGENGGIFARMSKTFMVKGSRDERVDIEVLSGKAFVKDEEE